MKMKHADFVAYVRDKLHLDIKITRTQVILSEILIGFLVPESFDPEDRDKVKNLDIHKKLFPDYTMSIVELVKSNRLIATIQAIRSQVNLGLKECRDLIELNRAAWNK